MDNNEKARKIISENLYMTISVASKQGDPWIANIYYAVDSDYNFYWYSPTNSHHSTLIRENPVIAISIFNSTAVGDDVDAVYTDTLWTPLRYAHRFYSNTNFVCPLSCFS